jgi:hypothetical protein
MSYKTFVPNEESGGKIKFGSFDISSKSGIISDSPQILIIFVFI